MNQMALPNLVRFIPLTPASGYDSYSTIFQKMARAFFNTGISYFEKHLFSCRAKFANGLRCRFTGTAKSDLHSHMCGIFLTVIFCYYSLAVDSEKGLTPSKLSSVSYLLFSLFDAA